MKIFSIVLIAVFAVSCSSKNKFGKRENVITARDSAKSVQVLNPKSGFSVKNLPSGWSHYTFFNTTPTKYTKAPDYKGKSTIACETNNGASMLLRQVDIEMKDYPSLWWSWKVEKNVTVKVSEMEKNGDDSPARFFLVFRDPENKELMMELYWSPQRARRKTKRIDGFFHYAVRGKRDSLNTWYDEKLNLRRIAQKAFKTQKNLRLSVIGLFCDSDGSGSSSSAKFSNIRLIKKN